MEQSDDLQRFFDAQAKYFSGRRDELTLERLG
jgi:uncharacterized protein (DUF1810 family)